MSVLRRAPVAHPVHDLIAGRWSPRAIGPKPVARETIARLFEAARWAPSCFNEQPWGYVFATRDDAAAFERLGSCLVEGNGWARQAWMLALSVARVVFERNGKANLHAWHDVGAASENMFLQAADLGVCMHQMAGFDRERARDQLGLQAHWEPVAMIAVGYPGDLSALTETLRAREAAPRERRALGEFVFEGAWGRAASL